GIVLGRVDEVQRKTDLSLDRAQALGDGDPVDVEAAVVAVSDYADLRRDSLLHVDGVAIPEGLGPIQGQVRLSLDLVDAAEDDAAGLVLDLDELVALYIFRDRTSERGRPDVPVDHANEPIAMVRRRPMVSRGFHACIPFVAR